MTFATQPLTERVGTEIRIDKQAMLSGAHAAAIRSVLEQRGVVIFRDVNLDDADLHTFAATLGNIRMDGRNVKGSIMKVTFDKEKNPAHADYFRATLYWHMDGTWEDVPPLASILSPRILPEAGGQTEFANTYAAYEDLPEDEKRFLDRMKVVFTQEASQRHAYPEPTEAQLQEWRAIPDKTHPLVWRHRSGRKSLVLSSSASRVVGLDRAESDALLRRLHEWMTQRHYVYQHQWKMGDVLIWDNTGTMHRVLPFDQASGRTLHRITLLGEESLADAA